MGVTIPGEAILQKVTSTVVFAVHCKNNPAVMGGGVKIDIPDYKIYKVTDHPDFVWLQEQLASEGLKDPWIRNHVWKYRNELTDNWRLPWYRYFMLPGVMRGVVLGIAATGVYAACDSLFGVSSLIFGKNSHGHGHGHATEETHTSSEQH